MKSSSYKNPWMTVNPPSCINEKGVVLVIALAFIAILAMAGTTSVVVTTTDIKIGSNYRTVTQALNASHAGIAESRGRLGGSSTAADYTGDPAATPDPLWSAYILTSSTWSISDDPHYDGNYKNYFPASGNFTGTTPAANTLQSPADISYFTKIRHKREYDAESAGHTTTTQHYDDGDGSTATNTAASPGSIVYFGDDPGTPTTVAFVEFTNAAPQSKRDARPVEIVRAYGSSAGSSGVTEIEAIIVPTGLDTNAVLYAKNNITSNGTVTVDGTDHGTCGTTEPPVGSIYTYPTGTSTTLNGASNVMDPTPPQDGDSNIMITDLIAQLKDSATEIITSDQNNSTYGADGASVTCYSNTSDPYNVQGLKLQGVTGYGLLLVDGDLELGGGFTWHGLILTSGTMVFNGGGGPNKIQINGAALANSTVAMNGSVDLHYDSCYIADAMETILAKVSRWRAVYD